MVLGVAGVLRERSAYPIPPAPQQLLIVNHRGRDTGDLLICTLRIEPDLHEVEGLLNARMLRDGLPCY